MTLPTSVRAQTFVTAPELADLLAADRPPIVLDIRDQDSTPDGRSAYLAGHLPNAIYVDLASLHGSKAGLSGSRPVPDIATLQEHVRAWGIHNDDAIVVYDDVAGTRAGRAWWTLRWAGLKNVRLLDGGLGAWLAGGYPVSTAERVPTRGDATLSPGNLPTLDADAAAAHAARGTLFDARTRRQFEEGHIPGASLTPTRESLTSDGLLADEDALRAHLAEQGIEGKTQVGIYCGSGMSAAHEVAVLTSLGIPAELFVGSFSAWSADPARPIATGEA